MLFPQLPSQPLTMSSFFHSPIALIGREGLVCYSIDCPEVIESITPLPEVTCMNATKLISQVGEAYKHFIYTKFTRFKMFTGLRI